MSIIDEVIAANEVYSRTHEHTTEHDLRNRIQNRAGTAAIAPAFFYAFQNIDENVRHQLQKLRTHPWIPKEVTVRGFVYDVLSGLLREIKDF